MNNYADILSQLISKASLSIDAINESEMDHKPNPQKWSKKEILGHLIDSAYNNHRRFIAATSHDDLNFNGYDQDLWVEMNNYQERDKEEILITWEIINNHLEHLIRRISEDTMQKKTTDHNFDRICMKPVNKGQATSLAYLIWDYLFHLEHHLNQIVAGYQKILPEFGS